MAEVKVSIVVPVYNGEIYMRECLNSLTGQTLSDIEIICIDDGSKDNSLKILEEYQKNDSRIKILTQENQGASSARNLGLKNVQGEYVVFCDCDDWLKVESCELLYNFAQKNKCDFVLFPFYQYRETSFKADKRLDKLLEKTQGENTTFDDSYEELFKAPFATCGKFYKTSLIKENNIFFPNDIYCGEDRVFYLKALDNAKNINVLDEALYYYRLDSQESLTKGMVNAVKNVYNANIAIKNIIYSSKNLQNKKKTYLAFLDSAVHIILLHWNNIYNFDTKHENIKYLRLQRKEYSKYSIIDKFFATGYKRINNAIKKYKNLFIDKLIEPVYELEKRQNRIVLYLFERQVLNIFTGNIERNTVRIKYFLRLLKLRLFKRRKIKVAFLLYELEKWTSQALFDELQNSKYFEPVIYITCPATPRENITNEEIMIRNIEFFKSKNMPYEELYNIEENTFKDIEDFKADIIFYQQPWAIKGSQRVALSIKFALCCYIPYCFYSLKSPVNYFFGFHGKMWRYFVETPLHLEEYKKEYGARNCVALGSVKLDNYKIIDKDHAEKYWKTKDKKRIIYAPHHSFDGDRWHCMSTFLKNGKFILDFAKSHPETEWIIRPHPAFKDRLLRYDIMTPDEADEYFKEWSEFATISESTDNYYEQFITSDCLITDSISFLSEYLPTGNPVLHLRNENQKDEYNDLLKKITNDYYKIYSNEELKNTFEEVILNGNDYLKEKRKENIKYLMIDENKTTSRKIREYLEKELWLK